MRTLELLLRNLHFWFATGIALSLAIFAFAVLRIAFKESLWLDELHTSWSISGTWQEVAKRAAAGNQTPLYFWLVRFTTETLGHSASDQSEWILRLPSVLAWLMAIGLVAKIALAKVGQTDSRRWTFSLAIVAWVVLDRLQWFFASEARPYACVQLVSLAGWCCVESIVSSNTTIKPKSSSLTLTAGQLMTVWCVLSVTNIYLHLTAALPVVIQWIVGCGLLLRPSPSNSMESVPSSKQTKVLLAWAIAAFCVGLACIPILQFAFPVWQRRGQWATFASDISIRRAALMFPFVPVLLCVFVGRLVDRFLPTKTATSASSTETRWLWWSAMIGPWLSAWVLTALGVAPIFHQRFVLASALPIFVVGAIELLRIRLWSLRWITCVSVAIAITFSQGSISVWRAGYLVGSLRGEDWRGAATWVRDRIEPEDLILCSSGLIEANSNPSDAGKQHELPLEPQFAEYLSFPLLGIYQIDENSGRPVPVTALLGDHRQWASQAIEQISKDPERVKRLWLFYRGAPGRLKTKLNEFQADLKSKDIEFTAAEPVRFGNVFVVEMNR